MDSQSVFYVIAELEALGIIVDDSTARDLAADRAVNIREFRPLLNYDLSGVDTALQLTRAGRR